MKTYDILILGAGASGLMCAVHLDRSQNIGIVDTNEKCAKKLKISGGGKCNVTNKYVELKNFDGDERLISNALRAFSKEDLLDFLEINGVELELRKNRYYFCKTSSDAIIKLFKKKLQHTEMLLNHEILSLTKDKGLFTLQTSKGILRAKKVIVATGGKSFKNLGASEIGLNIAKDFGMEVQEFLPALVGLTTQPQESWMKELSGLSCSVHIKVGEKCIKEEMLFAHKGISGPAVLSASLYWKKGNISIDFMPNKNIVDLASGSKKQISTLMGLPKRLSKAILDALKIKDLEYKKLDAVQKKNLQKIHNYEFAPAGNFGFTKAEVSRGGVRASGLDALTLESKSVDGLYFIGEVVDVTGELGGYNFQWAFSSAVMCANFHNYFKIR